MANGDKPPGGAVNVAISFNLLKKNIFIECKEKEDALKLAEEVAQAVDKIKDEYLKQGKLYEHHK